MSIEKEIVRIMQRLKRIFVVAGSLFLASLGSAKAVEYVSLKDIAQKAVLTNPDVLAKWHAFKAAEGDIDVGRGGLLPRLDFTAGVGREALKQPGASDRFYTRNGYTLTLNQLLYDGFSTVNDIERLDRARLTRYFELLDASENAALEAVKAYLDVIRYRNLVFLAENNYVEHRASYEQLQRRAQTGAGRKVDVEHAASRLALAELNLHTEAANLHDVTARYIRLVGDAPPQRMFAPPRLADDFPASEIEALRRGMKLNPALRAAVENIEAAQRDLDVRRGAFHPRVDVRLRDENTRNYQGVTGDRRNTVAEVVLSYNLLNGGSDAARNRVYADRRDVAYELRNKACRDMRQTLSIAYNDVSRIKAQAANLELQVNLIEKTRDAYKSQFTLGQRSLLDLLDTENELLNARRSAVHADSDMSLAYLRTQAGIGRLSAMLGLKNLGNEQAANLDESATGMETEICPAHTPEMYQVNINALTERALSQLDSAKGGGVAVSMAPMAMPEIASPLKEQAPPEVVAKATPAERLKAWAHAWSAKDAAAYLAFYAPSFVPADGSSRDAWQQQRQARISKATTIRIDIDKLTERASADGAMVTKFEQHYVADAYSDRVLKTLEWIKEGDVWSIRRETARSIKLEPAVEVAK